jgi:hypothetical protein
MPALPADIAAASRDATTVTWSSAAIAARYPNARDGSAEPPKGYFDNPAHAQAAVNARGALIGVERRRFTAVTQDIMWPDLTAGFPTARVVDAENAANRGMLIARIELDLEFETTNLETFG